AKTASRAASRRGRLSRVMQIPTVPRSTCAAECCEIPTAGSSEKRCSARASSVVEALGAPGRCSGWLHRTVVAARIAADVVKIVADDVVHMAHVRRVRADVAHFMRPVSITKTPELRKVDRLAVRLVS